jgi:hypothetical protein
MFSLTTIAASTIVHMAIAIPHRLMIFEGIPKRYIKRKVNTIPTTKETTTANVAPKCHKNIHKISAVIIISCTRTFCNVSIAHLIREVLS